MHVYGEIIRAQLENLSADPTPALAGRILWNTTSGRVKIDTGSVVKAFLLNDANIIIGTNGTAANNVRIYRAGVDLLQFVYGNDVTTEGTLSSTSIAMISARHENYVAATLPAAAFPGRMAWVTDTGALQVDTGSTWKTVTTSAAVFHTQTFSASGSWTVPAGVTQCFVVARAGSGGGGGGRSGSAGGGQGGGGACSSMIYAPTLTPGDTVTITIGAPGAGGGAEVNGSDGGDTIFSPAAGGALTWKGAKGGFQGVSTPAFIPQFLYFGSPSAGGGHGGVSDSGGGTLAGQPGSPGIGGAGGAAGTYSSGTGAGGGGGGDGAGGAGGAGQSVSGNGSAGSAGTSGGGGGGGGASVPATGGAGGAGTIGTMTVIWFA